MEQQEKKKEFKPINATVLHLQILKEQGLNKNAKYLRLINFRKYTSQTTTTLLFERGQKTLTVSPDGTDVFNYKYQDRKNFS